MWILEGEAFGARKLWLRPGKTYLFGRTESVPGQLTISHKTISRKHLVIRVDPVAAGDGRNLKSRSVLRVEDLDAKKGTILNGIQIRGQNHVVSADNNTIQMGSCPELFRLFWQPAVFSFSFTAKELRADPWSTLGAQLEQLDIKYSAEFEANHTSHVVSKKRNTSKGLQALIYGRYIVTEAFINAIVQAATLPEGLPEGTNSPLEANFETHWPDALEYLPPRGEEPSDRPVGAYAPDTRRRNVFEGYTFIFYEKKQFENLLPVITSGLGKAYLQEAVPEQTTVESFVRYVKSMAGEKDLGSFEDGSEGNGVVVVRYVPGPKGSDLDWYIAFFQQFAQLLDHRPIDQRDFLEAILGGDASMLRRPLEEEVEGSSFPPSGRAQPEVTMEEPVEPSTRQPAPRRGGGRRFKGFVIDSDSDDEKPLPKETWAEPIAPTAPTLPQQDPGPSTQDSLFVSQVDADDHMDIEETDGGHQNSRKRPHDDVSALPAEIAPNAAAFKRQRIAAGEDVTPAAVSVSEQESIAANKGSATKAATKVRSKKTTMDPQEILELARKRRQEADEKAAAERRELETLPEDGIDYAAIRRMHIIEDCEVHYPDADAQTRSREQEVANGRWDPRWNGRKNFKRFRKHGDPTGRPAPRIIIGLEEAKPKGYGIGDGYWLEGDESTQNNTQNQKENPSQSGARGQPQTNDAPPAPVSLEVGLGMDSSDEDEEEESIIRDTPREPRRGAEPSRSRAGKAAEKANTLRSISQVESQARTASSGASSKRIGSMVLPEERPAKKPRRFMEVIDSDDSDDELRFKFGRRR